MIPPIEAYTPAARGLTSFHLRLLAVALMAVDHAGYALFSNALWMRAAGRLAFPLFAFLLVEGFCHTRSLQRYLLRMALFALVSQAPFALLFFPDDPFGHWNIFFTLTAGLIALWALRRPETWLRILLPILMVTGCELMQTDYGAYGVLTVIAIAYLRGNFVALGAAMFTLTLLYIVFGYGGVPPLTPWAYLQCLYVLAVPLMALYNGREGFKHRAVQWGFYLFYPVHLLLLALLANL